VASDLLLERNMQTFERYLKRWRDAGLIDDATESSIRAYESEDARPSGRRWQVILALVMGGILLGAGVLLFVAANWDDVSPGWRLTLVLAMLALFHGAGIVAKERFSGFAMTMHALGTVAAGAAIALVGQIFNMQEHWPAAVMLWALCALAGWWLLGDQFQQTLSLLLLPAWLISEWMYRASVYRGSEVYLERMIAVLAVVYLTGFLHSRKRVVFGILFGVSAIFLCICVRLLADGWQYYGYGHHDWGFLPLHLRLVAFVILIFTLGFGWYLGKQSGVPAGVAAVMAFVLPWAQTVVVAEGWNGQTWKHSEANLFAYALVSATAFFLAWWGVREGSKALINYGIAAFALTVMWFYFSSLMDKLGRSLGLIMLGVLFLAGGWLLEKMRRKLVGSIPEVAL
jgi:uncharacterized membrane protein